MDPKILYCAASQLFQRALEMRPERRETWLKSESADSPLVLAEALSLLRHHADDSFLVQRPDPSALVGFAPVTEIPEYVGAYRIKKLLGWGGSGVVYLAVQAQPEREVALKVLRADMNQKEALIRFHREAEMLGRLDHPGISRVYEAGSVKTANGAQAYIAMEVVHGAQLIEFGRKLDHGARLALALQVARIIEHAHSCGIVHRDLKPANILVRADGQAVVLDFGIARHVLESQTERNDWTELAGNTVTGQLLGTLAYMSPEQAAGDVSHIDERTDVYALGVILYELVSGKLPHDTRDKLITEVIRMIERGEARPISHYGKQFGGELETIIEKCLRREQVRRYRNAGQLADDLQCLIEHRPIQARPPSRIYRVGKFLRRHRQLSLSALALVAILSSALLASLSSLRVANQAERQLRVEQALTLRFADTLLLDKLNREVDQLWPARPESLPMYDRWIAQAEQLSNSLRQHRSDLSTLAEHSKPDPEKARLTTLVHDLEQFVAPSGPLAQVVERRQIARNLKARTIDDYAREWKQACDAIAAAPVYDGLQLPPQIGLIPLEPDPQSGLWEFCLYGPTGSPPERDLTTEQWIVTEETGIVFVLLPGSEFLFGAQRSNPSKPNFDPEARDHEGPPERIALAPFFLSKYEWNQAQWLRVVGTNPSYFADGDNLDHYTFGNLCPVESMNWNESMQVLSRLGLTLPTEAQWEYAMRAGSSTIYWSGDDHQSIFSRSNTRSTEPSWLAHHLRAHAPVGLFPPNAFGLHDMTGNVSEWCLDVFKVSCRDWPVREGDGLRLTSEGAERVRRGGAWTATKTVLRSARRDDQLQYSGNPGTGFRAARSIEY